MAIGDDWTIDTINKRIYHSAGATVYEVNELYSWLMDTFDEQAYMDDPTPISAETPTEYTMTNEWFIDDESIKYLKKGAIKTVGYNGKIQVLSLLESGYTNCVSTDIGKQVQDDLSEIGVLLAYDNTIRKWWIRSASTVADASSMTITGGTGAGTADGASVTGEDLYANVYTLGTIETGTQIYIFQAGAKISGWWGTGHIDALIKVKEAGTEKDGAVVTVFARVYTDLYDNYEIDLTVGGRNAVPIATSNDLDNQTAIATVADYINLIRIAWVHGTLDYDTKTGDNAIPFWVVRGGTSTAIGFILNSPGAGATGTLTLGSIEGTFQNGEALTLCSKLPFDALTSAFTVGNTVEGVTSTATGIIRKIEYMADGAVGILHLTNITGTWQDNETVQKQGGGGGSATTNIPTGLLQNSFSANANGTLSAGHTMDKDIGDGNGDQPYDVIIDMNGRTVKQLYEFCKAINRRTSVFPCYSQDLGLLDGEEYIIAYTAYAPKKASPLGTFAGGVFFGARGVWIEDMHTDDIRSYQLIDSNASVRNPPNLQAYTVTSLEIGDRVAIFPTTGDNIIINKGQYSVKVQGAYVDNVSVSETIPADRPDAGTIRVVVGGTANPTEEDVYSYASVVGSTVFMLPAGVSTYQAYSPPDSAYVPYMDKTAEAVEESETVVYTADRYVMLRVRLKGIVPFQIKGQYTSIGWKVAAIRTTDTIVT